MLRYLCSTFLLLISLGCEMSWGLEYTPTTPQERQAVQEAVERQIATLKVQQLGGHDQDWDDTINAINARTRENLCRPTMWEWKSGPSKTGRWKYVEDVPLK